MIRRFHYLRSRLLDSIERRFRRSRPGSVLILVVALLVLLALLGTAYINTAQSDRYSSSQNSFNTEVELLLQGLENVTQATIVNALFDPKGFHVDSTTTNGQTVIATDYPLNEPSAFLADRYPTVSNVSVAATAMPGSNPPLWQFLSTLPIMPTTGSPPVPIFESPYSSSSPLTPPNPSFPNPYSSPPGNIYQTHSQMYPMSVSWYVTDSSGTHTVTYPALAFQVFAGNPPAAITYMALAADTDGDGIADAALFRLPVGELNGITYYGAVRVIDNSAAINAAVAWQPNYPAPAATLIPGNMSPVNLDLLNLLNPTDTLTGLNGIRFGGTAAAPVGYASLTPINDRPTALPPPPPTPPAQETPIPASFAFGDQYEAFWMQLGRRLANPGYNANAPSAGASGVGPQYVALSSSEMATMVRRFILRDPSVTTAANSSSVLEQQLPNSVFNNARSSAYQPKDALLWYQQNFDYANSPGNTPIRPMLVTSNPVSNFVASKLYSRGSYVAGNYSFGDWVLNNGPGGDNRAYVCLQSTASAPDPTNPSGAFWERQPWVSGPTKVSANTATFGQLWAGYFSAMSNLIPLPPATSGSVVTASPEGSANSYATIMPNKTSVVPQPVSGGDDPAKAMFRSSIRNGKPAHWGPAQELQLRAALAAINTLDLRDVDDDVTSRDIVITGDDQATQFKVTVYGTEKQPYITEIYANNDTPGTGTPDPTTGMASGSYIAVELYNPTNQPITLTNWQLATISRPNDGSPLNPQPIASTKTGWATTPPTIPARGFIVLSNSSTPPSAITSPPTGPVTVVTGMEAALNNEMVLLRPRLFSGGLTSSPAPTNTYNENTTTDLVPVDSYDFTGLDPTVPEGDPGTSWHYIRPNDPAAGKAWHFVYPGPYLSQKAPGQQGTAVDAGDAKTNLKSLGIADPTYASTVGGTPTPAMFIDRPLQVAAQDMAGPKTVANYPYGGFARNGDLLQVTYIGAYRIEDSNGKILELNPVTLDSAMANDPSLDHEIPASITTDPNAIYSEQMGRQNIGRFSPVHWADTLLAGSQNSAVTSETAVPTTGEILWDDYIYQFVPSAAQPPAWPRQTAYHWTLDLFDYVTVQAPHDDYLPDTDPAKYPAGAVTAVANSSYLVANAQSTNYPTSATEETAPVHGRININTASWRVLATLPWIDGVTFGASPNAAAQIAEQIAQSIVYYRDVDDLTQQPTTAHPHGPFQSIDELNNVLVLNSPNYPITAGPLPAGTPLRTILGSYQTAGAFPIAGPHAANTNGDLSPFNSTSPSNPPTVGTADNVIGDFENQNLALNRISNLITTRSDSFTAYVMVQGWRNAGTPNPQLVVQRRAAFIIDRSTLTAANNTQPVITNVGY